MKQTILILIFALAICIPMFSQTPSALPVWERNPNSLRVSVSVQKKGYLISSKLSLLDLLDVVTR